MIVSTPSINRTCWQSYQRVLTACSYIICKSYKTVNTTMFTTKNLNRYILVCCTVITKLTVIVQAPSQNCTITCHSKCMIFSCCNLKYTTKFFSCVYCQNRNRSLWTFKVTVTKLTICIITPSPNTTIWFQCNCEIFTWRNHRSCKFIRCFNMNF